MKKGTILILSIFYSFCIYGQVFNKSINPHIVSLIKATKSGAIETKISEDYNIVATKEFNGYLKIELQSSNHKKESFEIKPLTLDLFRPMFEKHFEAVLKTAEGFSAIDSLSYSETEINKLFTDLILFERIEETRPLVAEITLKESIPVEIISLVKFNENGNCAKDRSLIKIEESCYQKKPIYKSLDSVQLELTFYNGFIEKVELSGKILDQEIRFTNQYSIGISAKNDIKNLAGYELKSYNSYTFICDPSNKNDSVPSKLEIIKSESQSSYAFPLTVNMSSVIDYDPDLDINANDISPEPTKLTLDEKNPKTQLYKELSTKLFEGIIFSDFEGVFNEESPNGIIQIEVAKKFFMNTKRYPNNKRKNWPLYFLPPIWYSEAIGFFEYIEVSARISKLEDNNKFLLPEMFSDQMDQNIQYFSPISVLQHQSFSIGGDMNVVQFENQNKKNNTIIDLGIRYGKSGLQTSEQKQEFFNTLEASAVVHIHFIPEKRYGFQVSDRISYYEIFNDFEIPLKSIDRGILVDPKKWYNQVQLQFYVNTSSTGKLFLRYNLISELSQWDNNFSQLQFGYSFYILGRNGKLN